MRRSREPESAAPRAARARPGTVYLVGAGPGDPGLFTLRGLELLASADAVLHDELVAPSLLSEVREDALVEYVGKRGHDPTVKQLKQSAIDARIVELASQGRSVVRLKGGDPFLFGRGSEEAEVLRAAGIPFEIVPGVTSPIAAAAYAGISLTHRDLASSVVFVSGTTRHGSAFDFGELASHTGTVCVLMGLAHLRQIADALVATAGRDPETPVAVIRAGTRADQEVVTGTLRDIAERVERAGLGTPALIVVGPVVTLREQLRWFDTLPLFGKRVLVARTEKQASRTSQALLRRGAVAVELPLIELHPMEDTAPIANAITELGSYQYVLFTSDNAVEAFMSAVHEAGRDARVFAGAALGSVGEETARSLARHGLRSDVVPASFRGDALADAVIAHAKDAGRLSGRVLLPRALVAREDLPDKLRAAGFTVDVVPVYRTVRAGPSRRDELLQKLATCDAVLLTSSSTAEALVETLGDASSLADKIIASIGPISTTRATALGLTVAVTATTSTIDGMIDALEALLSDQNRPRTVSEAPSGPNEG